MSVSLIVKNTKIDKINKFILTIILSRNLSGKMNDKAKIIDIINVYFNSMYKSDAKLVKQVFHPIAKIIGYVEGRLVEMDTNQFAKFVSDQKPSPSDKNDQKKLEIVSIGIAGKTAMALIRDDYLRDTYLDTLSFIKIKKIGLFTINCFILKCN